MKKIKKPHVIAHMTVILITAVYLVIIISTGKQFRPETFPKPEKQSLLDGDMDRGN